MYINIVIIVVFVISYLKKVYKGSCFNKSMTDMLEEIKEALNKSNTVHFRIDGNGKLRSLVQSATTTINLSKAGDANTYDWLTWDTSAHDGDTDEQAEHVLFALKNQF